MKSTNIRKTKTKSNGFIFSLEDQCPIMSLTSSHGQLTNLDVCNIVICKARCVICKLLWVICIKIDAIYRRIHFFNHLFDPEFYMRSFSSSFMGQADA
jgi:hypothetical protein